VTAVDRIDFWVQFGISQLWAALIVAATVAFGLGMGLMALINRGQINALKAQRELSDQRAAIQRVHGNSKEVAQSVADMKLQLAELKAALTSRAPQSAIRPILDKLESDTGAVEAANTMTTRIATLALIGRENSDTASFSATSRSE
jgi:hypothetical protein